MGRAEQRSIVAKVRVYELAKEFGVESKVVMTKLQEMGEFVRSASSTVEAPVVRRLKEALAAESPQGAGNGAGSRSGGSANGGSGGAAPARPQPPRSVVPSASAPAASAAQAASPAAQ